MGDSGGCEHLFHELSDEWTHVAPGRNIGCAQGAGHDAGILAPHVPSAMLYVRNPTGVSHAPEEACEVDDQRAGVDALVKVLARELGIEHALADSSTGGPTAGGAR